MLTVKSSKKNLITFPENLLAEIGLEEGEKIDIRVRKGSIIILKKTADFFALEGTLKDNDVKKPLKELDKAWKKWEPLESLQTNVRHFGRIPNLKLVNLSNVS